MASKRPLLLCTTLVSVALVAGVFALAGGRECCQDKGLFELPKFDLTKPKPPEGCTRATEQAWVLLGEVEKEIEEPLKAAMREAVADKDKDETVAEAWSSAADVAFLNLHVPAALWAELNALKTEWSSDSMVQAGVYLALMKLDNDAKLMLHCAYDADNRSPYLLEALANVYKNAGDKTNAVKYINEALAMAPEDEIIKAEKYYFNSGTMPPRPAPQADPFEEIIAELKAHHEKHLTRMKRNIVERNRAEAIMDEQPEEDAQATVDELRADFNSSLATIDETKRYAKMTPAQFKVAMPGNPDSLRIYYRNLFFYDIICRYLGVTDHVLIEHHSLGGNVFFNREFWARVIGLGFVEYARVVKSLRDFEYMGSTGGTNGSDFQDWGGSYFKVMFDYAGVQKRVENDNCGVRNRGNPEAEKACRLAVDIKYCTTVRELHRGWMDETESFVQRLGRRFDGVATSVLVDAGGVGADAFAFASKWMKQMNVAPTDTIGKDMVADLNTRYRQIVDNALGAGEDGPAHMLRIQEEAYQVKKQNSEADVAMYKENIESICEPVDLRALEQLMEEHRRAVREMLFERLIKDLNVSWDPNANCTFSMGKWISVKVDIDGNVDVKGKWSPYKKAFDGSPTFEIGDKFKLNIEDISTLSGSVSAEHNKSSGIFTGGGEINVGVSRDPQTGQTTFPVKIEGKLGVGYKTTSRGQEFGVTCYPGSLKADFDARVVARDIIDLYYAL
ncbi:MAG: hypothetical protein WD716_09800 [Fimbriimonadaceae bacterium]